MAQLNYDAAGENASLWNGNTSYTRAARQATYLINHTRPNENGIGESHWNSTEYGPDGQMTNLIVSEHPTVRRVRTNMHFLLAHRLLGHVEYCKQKQAKIYTVYIRYHSSIHHLDINVHIQYINGWERRHARVSSGRYRVCTAILSLYSIVRYSCSLQYKIGVRVAGPGVNGPMSASFS